MKMSTDTREWIFAAVIGAALLLLYLGGLWIMVNGQVG